MSENENEPEPMGSMDSNSTEDYLSNRRMRAVSEIITTEPCIPFHSPRDLSMALTSPGSAAPTNISNDSAIASDETHVGTEGSEGLALNVPPLKIDTEERYIRTKQRSRRFSELSISDMPSETPEVSIPTLDINFPCSYEENLEDRGKSIVSLRPAAIKRVIIRSGSKLSRFNIVYTKDKFYWPQETIRHCRTGRIKRGLVLKRQFGVYYPDKSKDLIALKIMEKTAISECFNCDEDDVQTELSVMKVLSESGGNDHVLHLYDSLETKDFLIAVMELVDGDLHDMLKSIRSKEVLLDVFRQILEGYKYIVSRGYFHCDISLENVLIRFAPQYRNTGKVGLVAKLSDFGRVRKIDDFGHAYIDGDEVAGKPYYLAPEAYAGSYDAGPADIWSLGVVLYILLTGSPPFGIANDSDEAFDVFSEVGFEYLIPALTEHGASKEEMELLERMLSVDPMKRPNVDQLLCVPWLQ